MKRQTKPVVAALLMAAMISACASGPGRESTGEYIDDSAITTKVKAAFVKDKTVDALNIKVETYKGTVQLSGFADTQAEADRAVDLATSTPGVRAVTNDIRVKPR